MWWNGTSPSRPWILKCVELGREMTLCSHRTQNRSKVQWKWENRMKSRDRRSSDGFKKQLGLSSGKVRFCKCHMLAGGVFNQLIRGKKACSPCLCLYFRRDKTKISLPLEGSQSQRCDWLNRARKLFRLFCLLKEMSGADTGGRLQELWLHCCSSRRKQAPVFYGSSF